MWSADTHTNTHVRESFARLRLTSFRTVSTSYVHILDAIVDQSTDWRRQLLWIFLCVFVDVADSSFRYKCEDKREEEKKSIKLSKLFDMAQMMTVKAIHVHIHAQLDLHAIGNRKSSENSSWNRNRKCTRKTREMVLRFFIFCLLFFSTLSIDVDKESKQIYFRIALQCSSSPKRRHRSYAVANYIVFHLLINSNNSLFVVWYVAMSQW